GSDGSWTQEAVLGSRRATTNAQVGSTLLLKGDKIWAGGATASSFVGMVVGFERKSSGSWAETVTLTPFETITNRFGAALALVGDELWIGAPFSDGRDGRSSGATFNAAGAPTGMVRFGGESPV